MKKPNLEKALARAWELRRQIAQLNTELDEQKEAIQAAMTRLGIDRVETDDAVAVLQTREKAIVQDWAKFTRWVAQHKALDLFEKRVNLAAVRKRLAIGEAVPVELESAQVLALIERKEKEA